MRVEPCRDIPALAQVEVDDELREPPEPRGPPAVRTVVKDLRVRDEQHMRWLGGRLSRRL